VGADEFQDVSWDKPKTDSVLGKTILASLIIEEAAALLPKPTVLFFYFKNAEEGRDSYVSMARTLLSQLFTADQGILDYFYSKCGESGEGILTSRPLIEELLNFALGNCDSAYTILDGLDECSRGERKTIVSWFRELIENLPKADPNRLRCLFVSQSDSARKDYDGMANITVDEHGNENDIELYSLAQSEKLKDKLNISEKFANDIAHSVLASAEGRSRSTNTTGANHC
jgi:hypothetical protein